MNNIITLKNVMCSIFVNYSHYNIFYLTDSIITEEDLKNYKTRIVDPLTADLDNGLKMFTLPPPSSGTILLFIFKLMDSKGIIYICL